jgi:hypothetical protein
VTHVTHGTRRPPDRGVDPDPTAPDHAAMQPQDPSSPTPPNAEAASDALQALLDLKAQMERLHAELEYVRLMLKVGARSF